MIFIGVSMKSLSIGIKGMSCAMCARTIETALSGLNGVNTASVNLSTEKALVEYDESKVSAREIVRKIEELGYEVEKSDAVLSVSGMSCARCAKTIETVVGKLEGVLSVDVNISTGKVRVSYLPSAIKIDEIVSKINEIGYKVVDASREEIAEKEVSDLKKRLLFATILSFFLILMIHVFRLPFILSSILGFLISTTVLLYSGRPILKAAYPSLKIKTLNMDVMYSMGILASYLSGVLASLRFLPPEFMFYETASLLITFLTLGRYLEAKAKGKTSEALKKLLSLKPKKAVVLRSGVEEEIDPGKLRKGDVVIVKPGDLIPSDGVVIEGESYVDESMLTGEAIPVLKKKGDVVYGGTINQSSVLKVEITKVGEETVLSQIIRVVEEAMSSKPQIQKFADRIVAYFIPAVLFIAISSFVFWILKGQPIIFAFTTFIAVIVVACPCAFGLATPTAITVGMGKGAEMGILIKNGDALEIAEKVNIIAFDKTGTLTEGKPSVVSIKPASGYTEEEVLRIAASLEKFSNHPIARAILKEAESRNLELYEVASFKEKPGLGVFGVINGKKVAVGGSRIVNTESSAIVVVFDGKIIGEIYIEDRIKNNAAKAVEELKKMGKRVVMITGDSKANAEKIARKLGVEYFAEVLPTDKAKIVAELQKDGVVAFVGDGINDAPALAQADLGIAIGSGTDIAIESGDIVLIKSDPLDVVRVIKLSNATMRKVRQNIFWALFYNTILIPSAAGALYPLYGILFRPEWAGAAMSLSSVSVVTNSLLLKRFKG